MAGQKINTSNNTQVIHPRLKLFLTNIGDARTDLANISGQYGPHKLNASRELNKVVQFLNNIYPQSKSLGQIKSPSYQSIKYHGIQGEQMLAKAKNKINGAIAIIYHTGNPSSENIMLLKQLEKANTEIEMALQYKNNKGSISK